MTSRARDLTRQIIEQLIQILPGILDDAAPGGIGLAINIGPERDHARIEVRTAPIFDIRLKSGRAPAE